MMKFIKILEKEYYLMKQILIIIMELGLQGKNFIYKINILYILFNK